MKLSMGKLREFPARFEKFQRMSFVGELTSSSVEIPSGLCETGRGLFLNYSRDPIENGLFLCHYALLPENGGCSQCREAFLAWLYRLPL